MKYILLTVALFFHAQAYADSGLVKVLSQFSFDDTVKRVQSTIESKGMKVFSVIPHSESAKKIGNQQAPTQLFIFGNPKVGSLLMQCSQSVAIDLPQKMLVTENEKQEVHISYNSPQYLNQRHEMKGCEKIIEKVSGVLNNIAKTAATNE